MKGKGEKKEKKQRVEGLIAGRSKALALKKLFSHKYFHAT